MIPSEEDIIKMARQAGLGPVYGYDSLGRFASLVAQAAREACAKVCEDISKELGGVAAGSFVTEFGKHTHMSMAAGAENCAAAIRARGEDPMPLFSDWPGGFK